MKKHNKFNLLSISQIFLLAALMIMSSCNGIQSNGTRSIRNHTKKCSLVGCFKIFRRDNNNQQTPKGSTTTTPKKSILKSLFTF